MANRDKQITLYVSRERKRDLERRADDADLGVSPYINRLIERQLLFEAENEVAAETRAAERLQEVIDRGTRQLRDATDDLHEMQAKTGAYAIANFEFLKQGRGQNEINDALATGSRRLRDERTPADVEADESDENTDSPSNSDDDTGESDRVGPLDRIRGNE